MVTRFPEVSMRMLRNRFVLTCLLIVSSLTVAVMAFRSHFTVGVQADGRIVVPNGQLLSPAGTHIEVKDRPLGIVLSPDRRTIAVVTGSNFGQRALHLIDAASQTLTQTINISNSFVGVGFTPSGKRIYVCGGASNDVKIFDAAADGTFAAAGTIPIAGAEPSGLSITPDGSRVYVALNQANQVA